MPLCVSGLNDIGAPLSCRLLQTETCPEPRLLRGLAAPCFCVLDQAPATPMVPPPRPAAAAPPRASVRLGSDESASGRRSVSCREWMPLTKVSTKRRDAPPRPDERQEQLAPAIGDR